MKGKVYKPSMLISNNVPLNAKQLDVYNYMLKEAYKQLNENYMLDTFEYSVSELQKHFSYLDTVNRVKQFFDKLFEKEFNFNILNKDKTISSKIKSRFISSIEDLGNGRFKVSLEPNSVNVMRTMTAKQNGIKLPLTAKLGSYAHIELDDINDLTFYPAKVVYEILKDYKNINIPLIDVDLFKEATHTKDKFSKDYKSKVLNRIESDLENKNIFIKIEFKKQGRKNKWILIEKVKKEELKKAPQRKTVIKNALKTFEVSYIKDLTEQQKGLLNRSLENKGFSKCR